MDTTDFGQLLANNLMALNAKERDHLMRFAYLGETGAYGEGTKWISEKLETALRQKFFAEDAEQTKCVFAGMDYHLDWLHAALTLARLGKSVSDACSTAEGEMYRFVQQDYGDDQLPYKGASLRPVIGGNEDLDLLVVFLQQNAVTLFFVEAKGIAAVDKEQLARKLIRLDRILEASDAMGRPDMKCKFVWVAPKGLTRSIKGRREREEFVLLRDCASGYAQLEPAIRSNKIGNVPVDFIPLDGFPKSLSKVTRIEPVEEAGSVKSGRRQYKKWTVEMRWKSKE